MSSWSQRRRFPYIAIALIVAVGAIGVPVFFALYRAPTCFDGIQNGGEQGVDCGGACQKLCASSFLPPSVSWTRFEQVAPNTYNLAAYIINPNIDGAASDVPYEMVVYDQQGVPIANEKGTVSLPPHRNTLAFVSGVTVGKRTPVKALFQFTGAPNWFKQADPLSVLNIGNKDYRENAAGSSLGVTIENPSVEPLRNIRVSAVLYDTAGNALGFSDTAIDEIPAQGSALAPFTWPESHGGKVVSIEVLPVAE